MSEDFMNHDECIKTEIARFMELQRIKRDNGNTKNTSLEDALLECRATLEAFGVNVDGITIV